MNCGERIRKLRTAKNISQKTLAKEAGIPLEVLESWEAGSSLPDPGKLIVLAAVLGTTAEYLDTGVDSGSRKESSGIFRGSSLCFTAALVLYFLGFFAGVFTDAINLGGTPLLYYGTSPLAIFLLIGTVVFLLLGIGSKFMKK